MIAYDLETTPIEAGSPRPLYITAYGADFVHESAIRDLEHLGQILVTQYLTEENHGCKFVAWNGNNFDAYFIAVALVRNPDFIIRPYLTRSNSVRGLRVILACEVHAAKPRGWEFLDGMAMLGLVGVSLEKFLSNFAPELPKLSGTIDFEGGEVFDAGNPAHRAYAMRDSEGLYRAMVRAQAILMEAFEQPLAVTMGGACIRIFTANIPPGVEVRTPGALPLQLVREYVMRGGFCYCMRRYSGPVWKYDLNQAYAAAMRETALPCGYLTHTTRGVNRFAACYIARVQAWNPGGRIPFYYRTDIAGSVKAVFSATRIEWTWLTSIEVEQLQAEGWRVEVAESWYWESSFRMRDYVDRLERGRMAARGGPSGPEGTIYKNVGNHSYGKTVEQLEPFEYVLAPSAPPGFVPYCPDGETDPLENVYWRQLDDDEIRAKDYHQPQIGAFITAHVRMVVRRAALLRPAAWLYADTDCVVFSSDVTQLLDIDAKRYGAWKVEESGTHYQIIAKKVYAQVGDVGEASGKLKRSAKGMNVKRLTPGDFDAWIEGTPPVQTQVQRNNFLAVMRGADMYRNQPRTGTRTPDPG